MSPQLGVTQPNYQDLVIYFRLSDNNSNLEIFNHESNVSLEW